MKFVILISFLFCTAVTAYSLGGNQLSQHQPDRVVQATPVGRITNGQIASEGQFPYQVGLSVRVGALSSAWCGGSLIGSQWVLTAAHCTNGALSATVYLGATIRTSPAVQYTIDKADIIVHAAYDTTNLKNDISLIKIPAVAYSRVIQPVRLPAISDSYSTYAGDYAIASGWGRTSDSSTSTATYLQWARFQTISNTLCAATYAGGAVQSSNICIGTPNGVSTCSGDSGGPLVLERNNVQIGLTSFGARDGCELGYPVAFTRLTSYLQWIKSKTGIDF